MACQTHKSIENSRVGPGSTAIPMLGHLERVYEGIAKAQACDLLPQKSRQTKYDPSIHRTHQVTHPRSLIPAIQPSPFIGALWPAICLRAGSELVPLSMNEIALSAEVTEFHIRPMLGQG